MLESFIYFINFACFERTILNHSHSTIPPSLIWDHGTCRINACTRASNNAIDALFENTKNVYLISTRTEKRGDKAQYCF
jgi:hypothetical protein